MTEKKSALSKKVVGRRRALADSDDSSTEYEKELLLPTNSTDFCKNCCSCNSRPHFKSKLHEKQSTSLDSHLNRTNYREQLEIKVLNERVSQQVSSENWRNLLHQSDRLSEISTVFNTLISSIQVTSSCMIKLNRLLNETPSEINEKCDELSDKVNETLENIRTNEYDDTESPEIVDYKSKKSDLIKASINFSDILRKHALPSYKQLAKLEKQYDDIRIKYVDAKSKATMKMNSYLQKKVELLNDQLKKYLIPVLSVSSDVGNQLMNSLKESNVDTIKKRLESNKNFFYGVAKRSSSAPGVSQARCKNCNGMETSN